MIALTSFIVTLPTSVWAQTPSGASRQPLLEWSQTFDELLTVDLFGIEPWRVLLAFGAVLLGFLVRAG